MTEGTLEPSCTEVSEGLVELGVHGKSRYSATSSECIANLVRTSAAFWPIAVSSNSTR
jgi:hypothetical protein